jgi:hypothetical protein
MNPSSRSSRAVLAKRKIFRRRKPVSRKSEPYGELDRLDAEALNRARDLLNEGKTDRDPEWISPATLARFARPLGGSSYRQQWEAYLKKKLRIPVVDRLIMGLFFARFEKTRHLKVQDLFPSWRFSALTPVPAAHCIRLSESELGDYNRLSELYCASPHERRRAFLREAHKALRETT